MLMPKPRKNVILTLIYWSSSVIISVIQAMVPAICIQLLGFDCPDYIFVWGIFFKFIFYFILIFIGLQAIIRFIFKSN